MRYRPFYVISAGLCVLLLCECAPNSKLTALIAKYGYTEARPPSTLVPPGTVVYVRGTHPFEGGIVCELKESLGPNVEKEILRSGSNDSTFASEATSTFDISANYLNMIKADARYKDLKTIRATLSNVFVEFVSDSIILRNRKYRSAICASAIESRQRAHMPTTMIESALQADVVYTIEFESEASLSAEAKQNLIKDLAAKLNAQSSTATSERIGGTTLYWGIIDSSYLASLGEERVLFLGEPIPTSSRLIGQTTASGMQAISFQSGDIPQSIEQNPLMTRVPPDLIAKVKALKNPILPTPEHVAQGKALYLGKGACFNCHGKDGKGDGPAALTLNLRPRNFTNCGFQKKRTDGELFWILNYGSPGTGMIPLIAETINEEEAWKLITFVRSLCKETP